MGEPITFDQKFKQLPLYVQEWMAEESTELNGKIAEKYELNPEDTGKMVWAITHTIVGDIPLEEFPNKLREQLPKLDAETLRQMALDIAVKRFLPIRDFLKGVEPLIKSLGGEIPQGTDLYSKKYEEKMRNLKLAAMEHDREVVAESVSPAAQAERISYIGIGEVFEKYPDVQNQFITSKPIHLEGKDVPVNATLANWLQDYRQKAGAPPHSSIERAEYLFKSENAKNLDNSEKTILGEVLRAYDEGGKIPISQQTGKIVLSELFHRGALASSFSAPTRQPQANSSYQKPVIPKGNIVDLRK